MPLVTVWTSEGFVCTVCVPSAFGRRLGHRFGFKLLTTHPHATRSGACSCNTAAQRTSSSRSVAFVCLSGSSTLFVPLYRYVPSYLTLVTFRSRIALSASLSMLSAKCAGPHSAEVSQRPVSSYQITRFLPLNFTILSHFYKLIFI